MSSFYPLDDLPLREEPSPRTFASPSPASRTSRTQWETALCLVVSFASMALASPIDELSVPTAIADLRLAPLDGVPQPTLTPDPLPTTDLIEELLMDTRLPFRDNQGWTMLHPAEHELRRRAESGPVTRTVEILMSTTSSEGSSKTSTSETFASDSSTRTTTSSASASSSFATATATTSPLPTFFDGGLSNNFTASSCPAFIDNMINSEKFSACYPVSLLLQGSTSFFHAEESLVSISRVLDHACSANVTSCATYLADVATNLTKSENCGDDYNVGNPTVTEAYIGLVSYQVVYSATCLKNDRTSVYCFGDAVTNTTNASQTYFYFLPLNSSLPGGTNPICGTCLQDTMDIYHIATANRRQPIANTYGQAAGMVNQLCGSNFTNATLAEAITTSGTFSALNSGPSTWLLLPTLLAVASTLLL